MTTQKTIQEFLSQNKLAVVGVSHTGKKFSNIINVIYGECILMFAEPTAFFHRLHRWAWGVFGKLPK